MVRRAVSETDNEGPTPSPEAYLLTFMWYYRVMECKHYYEIDLDGKVTCSNCHAVVDEIETDNNDFWSSQMSFEE